jgi:hydrogenase expression/formation protein HypE
MGRVQAGDHIIVSGPMATHGVAIMSVREGLEFETDILSDTRPLNGMVRSLLDEFGEHIHLLRDPTRGGVATVLNEIARDSRRGVSVREKDLPMEEQVQSACEILGLDPLYVANEGIFLAVVSDEVAEALVSKIHSFDSGAYAADIGTVVDDHRGQVVLTSRVGGRRVVSMLIGEQLPRIC